VGIIWLQRVAIPVCLMPSNLLLAGCKFFVFALRFASSSILFCCFTGYLPLCPPALMRLVA
jgi:hypothetical protein